MRVEVEREHVRYRMHRIAAEVEQLRLSGCVRLLLQRLEHRQQRRRLPLEVIRDLTRRPRRLRRYVRVVEPLDAQIGIEGPADRGREDAEQVAEVREDVFDGPARGRACRGPFAVVERADQPGHVAQGGPHPRHACVTHGECPLSVKSFDFGTVRGFTFSPGTR
jgi:hypothetical protein